MASSSSTGRTFNVYRTRQELIGTVTEGTALTSAERLLREAGVLPCDVRIPSIGWFVWTGDQLIPVGRETNT